MNLENVLDNRSKLEGLTLKTYWPTGTPRRVDFTVVSLSGAFFVVKPGSSGKERRIPTNEIVRVLDRWGECKGGSLKRADFANSEHGKVFNTSYIGGIIDHLENN